jgi:acyl-ACP thioesterase
MAAESSMTFQTHSYHLDMNKHVNNTHYLDWLLEILTEEERQDLCELDVVFLRELYAQQSITVERYQQQLQILDASKQVIALAEWS